jgi:LmbE family N-acetylglucosaminyl deacetylase
VLTVSDRDLGTGEATWLTWPALTEAPAFPLAPHQHLVVLAPHPDDETLAAGGLMRQFASRGGVIDLVAVTDGDASHPRLPDREGLRARRRRERGEALRCLGVDPVVHELALPDGEVGNHERHLVARLRDLLDPSSLCLSPWRHDGHPDHDAVGRAAVEAARRSGARLVEYPVWAWHWASPGRGLPPLQLRRLALSAGDLAAKRRAIGRFTSQTRPLAGSPADPVVLPPAILARFHRPFETYLVGAP